MRYVFADLKSFITDYKKNDGEHSRKLIRKFINDCADEIMPKNYQSLIEKASGMSFRRYVESVDRCVLWQMILDCQTNSMDERTYLNPLNEPSNYCHPKRRGSGFSFGFNKSIPQDDYRIMNMVEAEIPDIGQTTKQWSTPTMIQLVQAVCLAEHSQKIYAGLLDEREPVDVTITDATITQCCQAVYDSGEFLLPDDTKAYTTGIIAYIRSTTDDNGKNVDSTSYETTNDNKEEIVGAMVDVINRDVYQNVPSSADSEVSSTTKTKMVDDFDPSLLNAIDVMAKGANKGGLTLTDILAKVDEKDEEIAKLKTIRATISSTPLIPQASKGEQDDLTYEVVMEKASKVFNKSVKAMKFDIPTLVWKNKQGSVVRHPMCPDVDDYYEFRPQHLIKFLSAHLFGQNIWVHGHTGTGKTTLAEQIASRIGYPVFRLNLDSNMERADIVGSKEIVVDNGQPTTTFIEGMLPKAMVMPCLMILDEMDGGMPDILFAVQRALEKKGLVLTEDGGRLVESHPYFRFVATANSRGQGDEYGWYQGVRPMNLATLDRFGSFIEVGYLSKDQESKLISKQFPSMASDRVQQVVQFCKEIREAFQGGELSTTISPRGAFAMCQYFLHLKDLMPDENQAMKSAVETVITDRAPMDSKQRVVEIAQRCFQ